jgi:hypothetical protein
MQHGKSLWATLGLAGLCACAEETGPGVPAGEPQAPECAGVDVPEPVTVETTVSVVATGPAAPVGSFSRQLSPYFIADGSGLYWHDARGSVFAHHPGEAGAVELLQWAEPVEGELRESFILGIAASADQVYVTNGYPTDVSDLRGIGDFRGPSRLLAVPKQGGPASLVLETEDSTLWPITVEGDRLIVMAQGTGGLSYHQVNLAEPEPRLERLPLKGSYEFDEPRFAGDGLVWHVAQRIVLTSGFDEAEPRRITLIGWEGFSVGPGYVMTLRSNSEGTVFIDTVDLQGKSRSCAQVPSSAPLSFVESFPAPLHVYYVNWVPGDDLAELAAHTELVQLELATGALTRLNLPGITVQNSIRIVGQDAESLYVVNGDTLLAIQKP